MSKTHDMQRFLRHFKEVTGKIEVDMKEVAKMASENGWPLPEPIDPLERLAQEFARAAREETMIDGKTGRPYRVNHAVPNGDAQGTFFWVEIDTAPRKHMLKSSQKRREQSVGDVYQHVLDLEHWSRVHPDDEPLTIETDFTFDVTLRKHASEDEKTG